MTRPGSSPNPKRITDTERILSVSEKMRRRLIRENCGGKGVGMKTLAQRYGIPEKTVRVIIHDSRFSGAETAPQRAVVDVEWEFVKLPGWKCHGELDADQARMYPA